MKWNAELYDQKHAFVFQFGENLVELLNVKADERILDLGCGTGYLTNEIQKLGADVVGIDASPEMIAQAKANYSNVSFAVANASTFHFDEPFDAVFSNAVLHWVQDQDGMIKSVYDSLRLGGRFVAEMGGKGNVEKLIAATKKVLQEHGYLEKADTRIWYFPSLGEYTSRLEEHGFRVVYAVHFDRKTPLQDGDNSVSKWIDMFGSQYFQGIPEADKQQMLKEITAILEPDYNENGQWYADYKRLRFIAIK